MSTSVPADPEAAFIQLYRRYQPQVLAYARRRLPEADAVEVVADVFLTAWRQLDALAPDQPLAWLYRIAGNSVANQWRRTGRWQRLQQRAQSASRELPAPDPAIAALGRDILGAALAALAETDREILRLVAREGLQGAELAEALGCSVGTAKVRVHRARRRLAQLLAKADRADNDLTARHAGATTEVMP